MKKMYPLDMMLSKVSLIAALRLGSILTNAMDTEDADTQVSQTEGSPLCVQPHSSRSMLADAVNFNIKNPAVISMHQAHGTLPALNYSSFGEQECLVWSYEQLDQASDRLAISLYKNGFRKDMRAVVSLYNSIEWALWFWTCVRLGTTFVPLDPRSFSRKAEISHYLRVIKPEVLVVGDNATAEAVQWNHDVELHSVRLKLESSRSAAVPSLIFALLSHPNYAPPRIKYLRIVGLGGNVISPEIADAVSFKLGATAVVAYGMTEGVPAVSTAVDEKLKFECGCTSLGKPTPGTRVKICEPGTRKILVRGEIGELHYSEEILINGYLYGDNTPFYSEGSRRWLNSGDQAKMDRDGAIYILGRYKDIIIRGGENLSPALIESCLSKAGVIAQVLGVPDEIAGELPLAVIQPLRPGSLATETMQALVTKELGHAHVPTMYLTLQDLGIQNFPMTSSGKVQKTQLRQIVMKHLDTQSGAEKIEVRGNDLSTRAQYEPTGKALSGILSGLLGQPEDSLPQDKPIHEMADSISILRLQSHIKRELKKDVSTKDIYRSESIRALAQELKTNKIMSSGSQAVTLRKGLPNAQDMVHTDGDEARALRTRVSVGLALKELGMSWISFQWSLSTLHTSYKREPWPALSECLSPPRVQVL
ncbi:MAG: hypothetical protein Q9164_004305 [Protoblastenia rupestris]